MSLRDHLFHEELRVELYHGECVALMAEMAENSVDAIVTDPPYGLEFMGKEWDRLTAPALRREQRADELDDPVKAMYLRHSVEYIGGATAQTWHREWGATARRVLKPGGHLVAFGGTRTHHRLMCALEDAGFEIRDCLMWLYGSGFPKSLDVSKAIDKAAGAEREVVGVKRGTAAHPDTGRTDMPGKAVGIKQIGVDITAPATDNAHRWQGWGTALKPAWEPIILARKPLSEPNVAANVLKWGTGALNVDGCRIPADWLHEPGQGATWLKGGKDAKLLDRQSQVPDHASGSTVADRVSPLGRWPANLVLDEAAAAMLDEQSGQLTSGDPAGVKAGGRGNAFGEYRGGIPVTGFGDSGGASRFFYTAKADGDDRDGSCHPTVKPRDLMAWLVRLVTPPGGLVLDPFLGSGPTVWAAREYGFHAIWIEREREYLVDAVRRLRQQVLAL